MKTYTTTCECGRIVRATTQKLHICLGCGKELAIGGPQGLGDTVENALNKIGGKQFKAAYKAVTGKDCGCNKRKQKLNEMFPYKATEDTS